MVAVRNVSCLCKGPFLVVAVQNVSCVCVRDLSCWLQCGTCHVSVLGTFPGGCSAESVMCLC